VSSRPLGAVVLCTLFVSIGSSALAQTHEHEGHAGHEGHTGAMTMEMREASGTSWLPDESPMYAIHAQHGSWQLMFHENLFVQFLHESGDRGDDQFGSINWAMGMARRSVGKGTLSTRAMVSLEPWTIGGCGYPDLLASGERCNDAPIHDRQHPHDLFMELAASYDAPLKGSVRWQIYGGPAGEPALGPVAFPHRTSAMPNPLAPIAHHWMDSTHVTFGVVTAGVFSHRWKAEASAFNGREPDSNRTDFDFGALDSFSGGCGSFQHPRSRCRSRPATSKRPSHRRTAGPLSTSRASPHRRRITTRSRVRICGRRRSGGAGIRKPIVRRMRCSSNRASRWRSATSGSGDSSSSGRARTISSYLSRPTPTPWRGSRVDTRDTCAPGADFSRLRRRQLGVDRP
jgi:hypothetical protein